MRTLLRPGDPTAVEIVNAKGTSPAVLLCDHASNAIPAVLDNLGLSQEQLNSHIGWDPGAAKVARLLSASLDAPLILSGYSRLVIDCNRPLSSPESIPLQSAGIHIPGNQQLTAEECEQRRAELFLPYHQAIAKVLDQRSCDSIHLLSIHSFTPFLYGQQRPWPVGISYWRDNRFARLLWQQLTQDHAMHIGFNQPYAIDEAFDYGIPVHAEGRGWPGLMVEIRQDGIANDDGAQQWARRLSLAYQAIAGQILPTPPRRPRLGDPV